MASVIAHVPSTSGRHRYTVRLLGDVYSCDCPAWRFQRGPLDRRVCKHILQVHPELRDRVPVGGVRARQRDMSDLVTLTPAPTHGHPQGDLWMCEKMDGVRALWDGEGTLWSRTGRAIDAPERVTRLLPRGVVIDGELWAGRGTGEVAGTASNSSHLSSLWRPVNFVAFDLPGARGGYVARQLELRALARAHGFGRVISHQVPEANRHAWLQQVYTRMRTQGAEGVVLRQADGPARGKGAFALKVRF